MYGPGLTKIKFIFRIIALIVFVIEFIRINHVNKIKFLNASDQLNFLKIKTHLRSHYSSKTPLLDIQLHTITESFPNFTVEIRISFSRAVRDLRQTLRSTMIIQHILLQQQECFPSHSWRIFVFFKNISDDFMGNR